MVNKIWQQVQKWFYLEPHFLPLMIRGLGLVGLVEGIKLWNCCFISSTPFLVPAWRVHEHLVRLPLLPAPCNIILFAIYAVVCLYFFAGGFKKIAVLYSLLFLLYYGSIELSAIAGHDRVLQICFLFALLFAQRDQASCSRRLIQVAVAICYFCSALQKALFPDFISGKSLKAYFVDTNGLTEYSAPWVPFLTSLSDSIWSALSVGCVGFEFILAFALFFRISRKLFLLLAVLFHTFLTIATGEFVFALMMWIGLAAFIEPKNVNQPNGANNNLNQSVFTPPRNVETIAAILTMMFLVLFPMRIFLSKEHPVSSLGFLDRCPWTFCMYLMLQGPVKVYATYKTIDGANHVEVLSGRCQRFNSDNQLIALANFMQSEHNDLASVQIDSKVTVNHNWNYRKTLRANSIDKKLTEINIVYDEEKAQ